jgi:hypothetical protein
MRKVTTSIIDVELDDGTSLELEAPFTLNSWEQPEVKIKQVGDRIVVAYLAHDSDAQNPLNDGGSGQIHHHPSSRYGRRDSDYYSALGLDSYGNIRVDEDAVQAHWRALVKALPVELFIIGGHEEEAADFRQALADEEAGDFTVEAQIRSALIYEFDLTNYDCAKLTEQIEPHLEWDWEQVAQECAEEGDKDAVLLDLYDHSGVSYSVSGHGVRCRWDTSIGAAVWVPDEYARDEIERRAEVYKYAYVDDSGYSRGRGIKHTLYVQNTKWTKQSDDWRELYQLAKEIARLKKKAGEPPEFDGRRIATLELAESACESYTAWSNGDCYGVCVGIYDLEGNLIEDPTCWGYVGSEWAEEALDEEFDSWVKHLAKPRRKAEELAP